MSEMRTVYGWVVQTREILLSFLDGLPFDVVTRELDDVGHGSIRGLLFHVAGCYRWWLHAYLGSLPFPRHDPHEFHDTGSLRREFLDVDTVVGSFIDSWGLSPESVQSRHTPWEEKLLTATPRWLFTHTTTHEFHHKGQIVMLARRLGHPPVETDLVLPTSFA